MPSLADGAGEGRGADVAGLAGAAEVQALGKADELLERSHVHSQVLRKIHYKDAYISFYAINNSRYSACFSASRNGHEGLLRQRL